jgi:hypothetical protein
LNDELKKLVDKCCEDNLSKEEMNKLSYLASADPSLLKKVMHKLLSGGPKAAFNLRFAPDLRLSYARLMKNSRPPKYIGKYKPPKKSKTSLDSKRRGRLGKGEIDIADHAVDRYIKRWEPNLSRNEAEIKIRELVYESKRINQKSKHGDELWMSPSGCMFVIKRDGVGCVPFVVTVLPKDDEELTIVDLHEEHKT